MRLVVDTNVMVRALLSHGPARIFFKFGPLTHVLVYHSEQLAELRDVASRPRLSIQPEAVEELVYRIQRYGNIIESDLGVTGVCRDPHDDYVLALAQAGAAEMLITEDQDLLVLNPWQDIRILRLNHFLQEYPLPELL